MNWPAAGMAVLMGIGSLGILSSLWQQFEPHIRFCRSARGVSGKVLLRRFGRRLVKGALVIASLLAISYLIWPDLEQRLGIFCILTVFMFGFLAPEAWCDSLREAQSNEPDTGAPAVALRVIGVALCSTSPVLMTVLYVGITLFFVYHALSSPGS